MRERKIEREIDEKRSEDVREVGDIKKGTVMENDMGKGGKKKRGRKDWCNGSFHFCPFVSLFCYFWYVFLQNCDFMGTHFKENTDDDVERNENIGKGSNGVVFKVLTKNRKHRLVVKEVRYLREESG